MNNSETIIAVAQDVLGATKHSNIPNSSFLITMKLIPILIAVGKMNSRDHLVIGIYDSRQVIMIGNCLEIPESMFAIY